MPPSLRALVSFPDDGIESERFGRRLNRDDVEDVLFGVGWRDGPHGYQPGLDGLGRYRVDWDRVTIVANYVERELVRGNVARGPT